VSRLVLLVVVLLSAQACGIVGGCFNCRVGVRVENATDTTVRYWYDDTPTVVKEVRPGETSGDVWNIPARPPVRRTVRATDGTSTLLFCQRYSLEEIDALHAIVRIVRDSIDCP